MGDVAIVPKRAGVKPEVVVNHQPDGWVDLNKNATKVGAMPLCVTATVKNTGKSAGDEVAQLYLTPPPSDQARPKLMLRGFQHLFDQ